MSLILDSDSYEGTVARPPKRKTPVKTNPLSLESHEKKNIKEISSRIADKLKIRSLSTYDQMLTFHAATVGIEAAEKGDWGALAAAAETGLKASFEVQTVSSYLFCKNDGALRNHATDMRHSLKEMALRLGHASEGRNRSEIDLARCLRAMTCAAISADRGLMHFVKENFGVVIRIVAAGDFPHRRSVPLTPSLLNLAHRYRSANVKMP